MDYKFARPSEDEPEKSGIQQRVVPANILEPRRIHELLKSPLHFKEVASNTINVVGSTSKGVYMQPRSTKELKQSPLHHKSQHSKPTSKSMDVLSPYVHPNKCYRSSGRKLDFNKETLIQIEGRVISYLRSLKDFQTITKPGLQKLSLNDFMRILSHLLTFTGIQIKLLDRDNQIEQAILAMRQLQYPYKMNKSWMLVPSASIQNVLFLLDFLVDFAPQANESFNLQEDGTKLMNFHKIEMISDESDMRLKQKLMHVESQLLGQAQTNESINQQLHQVIRVEAETQAQLKGATEQLNALHQQTAHDEQKMGRLCLEIWRSERELKQIKKRLNQELSSYQVYDHILEDSNIERRQHCIAVQELIERTRKDLQSKIEHFKLYMRHLYNLFGNHNLTWLESPLVPTVSQVEETQLQLKHLRQQIEYIKQTQTLETTRSPLKNIYNAGI